MKILKVAFKNINSLAGAWEIDFSSPDFRDGLFLIAGDTGAGKTSILDAITLALFGRTARVDISNEHNEVMTRGQKTCSAEVTFACARGIYRAGWTQSRTGLGRGIDAATGKRKAANKPFGAVKRSLAERQERGDFKEMPGTATELQKDIMDLIGISSFDQFLRTTMLAQGKFDQFLSASGKAADKDRSAILEQATGTDTYSRIGAAIHARCQAASTVFKQKEAELKGAQAMDADARAAKEAEAAGLREKAQAVKKTVDVLSAEASWHRESAKLEEERRRLEQEERSLGARAALLAPDVQREEQAQKARRLMAEFERRRGVEKAAKDAAAMAASRAEAIGGFQTQFDKAKKAEESLDRAASDAKTALDEALPRIERARALDQQIELEKQRMAHAGNQKTDAEKKLADKERVLKEGGAFVAAETEKIARAQDALACPPPEIALAQENVAARQESETAAEKAAAAAKRDWTDRQAELDGWVASAQEAWKLAERIESLAEKRAKLRPGEACPLCGAKDHPFCEGQLPKPDEKKKALEDAEKRRDAVKDKVAATSDAHVAATKALQKAREDCRRLEDAWRKKQEALQNAITEGKAKIDERHRTIKEAEKELPALREGVGSAARTLAEASTSHAGLVEERKACGIEGSPDAFQRRLQKAFDAAATAHASACVNRAAAWKGLENGIKEKEDAEKAAAERAAESAKVAAAFLDRCHEAGFTDEADWQTACWDEREIERVQRERKKLNDDNVSFKTRKDAWAVRCAEFGKLPPSTRTAETVSADLAAKTDEYKRLSDDALRREGELDADTKRRDEADALAAELAELCDVQARWSALDKEVGGEGGANFKLYAQGVTLSNLIEIGNEYLAPMTNGRYVMVWDVDGPDAEQLLPTIVDRRSGGEKRPVTNLSGGERFQVSLALALGLSRLNAGTLNVETLFLDEGFGTLDEKTLDVSISTLENLQHDGAKTIGIISHVKELEDRITTQIQARKTGNGASVLSGAGVSQLSL